MKLVLQNGNVHIVNPVRDMLVTPNYDVFIKFDISPD